MGPHAKPDSTSLSASRCDKDSPAPSPRHAPTPSVLATTTTVRLQSCPNAPNNPSLRDANRDDHIHVQHTPAAFGSIDTPPCYPHDTLVGHPCSIKAAKVQGRIHGVGVQPDWFGGLSAAWSNRCVGRYSKAKLRRGTGIKGTS